MLCARQDYKVATLGINTKIVLREKYHVKIVVFSREDIRLDPDFKVIEGEQKGVKIVASSTHLFRVKELQLRHVSSQMEKRSLSKRSAH